MSSVAISFDGVHKSFGRVHAVRDVSFDVPSGSFVGLIGHNGAGKSTCLKMLMGLLRPDQGSVRVAGVDVAEQPEVARRGFGAVPEESALYPWLTAREFLEFVADVRGRGDVAAALEVADLGEDADRVIEGYSQGMKRRTALAAAVLGEPPVLILDEALNGLDPPSAARVKAMLRRAVDGGQTVLLSTHVVETLEAAADRVIMLAHGRLVEDVTTADLEAGDLERLFLDRMAETREAGAHG